MSNTDPVRIAFVSSHAQLGGSERVLEDLVRRLPPRWVRSVVLLQDGPLAARFEGLPLKVIPTGNGPMAIGRAALALRRHLHGLEVDVVHANGVKAATVAAAAGRRTRPLVWMRHDFSFEGRLSRLVARRCTVIVGVSRAVVANLRDVAATEVVYPGVRTARLQRTEAREHLGLDLDGPMIGMIGRLHPAKGHSDVIEVLPDIAREVPGVRLVVVGAEDESVPGFGGTLAERADALGAGDAVVFTGYRADGRDLLRAFDLVVMASRATGAGSSEGFGLAAAEALAAGVPVVVTDVGALPEVVGGSGRVVAAGDRAALAAAIVDALTSGSTAAPSAAISSIETMVERMTDIYRAVAGSSGKA